MDASSRGSVSGWLEELKKGHEIAAQELWNRYFSHLIRLARHHLHRAHRTNRPWGQIADENFRLLGTLTLSGCTASGNISITYRQNSQRRPTPSSAARVFAWLKNALDIMNAYTLYFSHANRCAIAVRSLTNRNAPRAK
jgi:hypothetical protein